MTELVTLTQTDGYQCHACDDDTRDERGCTRPRRDGPIPDDLPPPSCPVLDVPLWFWRLVDEHRERQDPGRPRRDVPHATMLALAEVDGALAQVERNRAAAETQKRRADDLIRRAQRGEI